MKSYYTILLCCLLLGCNSSSNYLNNEVHSNLQLNGPIKTIVEKSWLVRETGEKILRQRHENSEEDDFLLRFSPDGREVEMEFYDDSGYRKSTDKYKFNEMGLKEYISNGGIEFEYTYDEYGRIKEEKGSKMRRVHMYKDDQLIKRISFVNNFEQGRQVYFTDLERQMYVEVDILYQDTVGLRYFQEDSLGQLLYEELVNGEGIYATKEITYGPDNKPSRQKFTIYDQGKQVGWVDSEFENGLLKKLNEYDADNTIIYTETSTYEFDKYNNWIRRMVSIDNGDFYRIEREIAYY